MVNEIFKTRTFEQYQPILKNFHQRKLKNWKKEFPIFLLSNPIEFKYQKYQK